jgi:cob(I)alamin adenosyltransferase
LSKKAETAVRDNPRVAAYASVDEVNSLLGLLLALRPLPPEAELLQTIQNDLFDVGSANAVPKAAVHLGNVGQEGDGLNSC